MTRQQIFHLVGLRPATSQRVRLGAERDGRLVAIAHEVNMYTSPHVGVRRADGRDDARPLRRAEPADRHRLTPLDLPRGEDVRAPGEAPGLLAVESAMDELADALGMDPVELRIRNEPDGRSRDRRTVQRSPAGRVHARRRAPLRLGAPPGAAGERARRPLAGRLRHGSRHPHALSGADEGEGSASGRTASPSSNPT